MCHTPKPAFTTGSIRITIFTTISSPALLDALRPGGLAILLTSASTLDSISLVARENFCSRAALLAAFRLPNTAFRQCAGTEIVADILVLQKNAVPCESFLELKEVSSGDDTGTMQINEYFTRHPDHILGRLSNTGKMYGKLNTPTVQPFDQNLGELLKSHLFEIQAQDVDMNASIGNDSALCPDLIPARRSYKEFAIFEQDGELYEYHKGTGTPLEKLRGGKPLSENEKAKIRSFLEVKTILNELCRLQIDPEATDEQIDYQRHQLNLAYDAHVRRFGVFSKRATYRSIANDPDYLKVSGCEYPEEYTETLMFGTKVKKRIYKKGDIFLRRTQWPWREPDSAADIVEAAKISYAYRHELNFNYIARLTGLESAEESPGRTAGFPGIFFQSRDRGNRIPQPISQRKRGWKAQGGNQCSQERPRFTDQCGSVGGSSAEIPAY